ncbi:MAG: hypothetical protein KAJ10_14110, partial [Thermodesulfovibrionia bacterium]|nr:hypothetical protein [Thermodesulfovibrionia bacterium]
MLHKHFCGIKFVCYLSLSILFFLLSDRAHAIKTFEESSGRFIIDLPDGWELQSQTDKNVFVFKGDGKSIIMEYVPNSNDRAKLFTKGVGTLQSSGLPNASPKEEIKDLTVNSNPARWGLYNDKMKYGSIEVELYAVVGSVLLREGGVYFLSILSEDSMKSLRGSLEKSFQSIRFTGQPVTGASKAEAAAVESLTGSPTTFEHKYLTLMLPPGWSTQEIPANFEKETIAWLKSDTIAGASVNVFCYRGLLHKKSSTRIR